MKLEQLGEFNHEPMPDPEIVDICCVTSNKIGYALVACRGKYNGSYLVSLSLATLKFAVVLNLNNPYAKISKIGTNSKYVFVGLDLSGVLIFELPNFESPIGRIPLSSSIRDLRFNKETQSLMVLEEDGQGRQTLSIFRVK